MDDDRRNQPSDVNLNIDAHPPARIAKMVEEVGVRKATMALLPLILLGFLAGAFIAFGAMLYTLVLTDPQLGLGVTRWLGGIAFSLGLVLVVVAGAELFTGNNLIVMAWVDRRISLAQLLRNWSIVYLGNLAGSLAAALTIWAAGTYSIGEGAVAAKAAAIAEAKTTLPFHVALIRGVLANVLVCLAVWLSYAAHTVSGKILAIIFPIAAFVALGFEHSVANMYLIPAGWLHGAAGAGLGPFLGNLIPVTIGNIIGGGVFVAGAYWAVYLRKSE
jgi:formate/nitrite transporter